MIDGGKKRYQKDVHRWFHRNLIGPIWAAWERSPYLRHYKVLNQRQYDSPDTIAVRQRQQLIELIKYAKENSIYYAEKYRELQIKEPSIDKKWGIQNFPLLTKQDLRDQLEKIVVPKFAQLEKNVHWKQTSGSTGTSVKVLVDEEAQQFKRACTLRSDEWSGWSRGERVACIWGNPDYLHRGWRGRLRNNLLDRATYLDTLKMDEAAMVHFYEKLTRRPPSVLFGHAHSIFLFATFCESQGGAKFSPRGIISTAMVLHDWERTTIERVFECPVTNRYGCEEVSLIACECSEHHGLHINADGVFLEVLRPNGDTCDPGEVGSIVVTDLVNRAMPIIRYQVGDMGTLSNRICPCGRGLPILEKIEGRIADYVTTSSGQLISGISLTENFAMLVPGLAQLQIVQESIDQFLFRVVRGADWGLPSVEAISRLVRDRFGPQAEFTFDYVEKIPQESSGKYRFCISKVRSPWSPIEGGQ